MDNPKTMMLIASIIGALAGVIFNAIINPLNNYYFFIIVFAMIGIGAALLALLAFYRIYEWVKQ